MSTNRRDFLKGILAVAVAAPAVAGVREAKARLPTTLAANAQHYAAQRHGKQPVFYLTSWKKTHDVGLINHGLDNPGTIVGRRELIDLDIYTEYPAKLASWCQSNHLIVDLPEVGGKHEIFVNNFEVSMADSNGEIFITVEGIVIP